MRSTNPNPNTGNPQQFMTTSALGDPLGAASDQQIIDGDPSGRTPLVDDPVGTQQPTKPSPATRPRRGGRHL